MMKVLGNPMVYHRRSIYVQTIDMAQGQKKQSHGRESQQKTVEVMQS
jgi:hypothetical protein